MKSRIAVIGGGISGVSAARLATNLGKVVVFESNDKIGGLIRCDELEAGLYHKLGGHVFNTKIPDVAKWFWEHFDRATEFYVINRDARILLQQSLIGYPIENHLYQLPEEISRRATNDLLALASTFPLNTPGNFRDFLLKTFGQTLCEVYFFPYNEKVWRCDLEGIPVGWLEGKLPMPKIGEILHSNIQRTPESSMVHSEFYYARNGGSQFVIDRLAEGLDIRLKNPIYKIEKLPSGHWILNGEMGEPFDHIIYTGDIRAIKRLFPEIAREPAYQRLLNLRTRGITNVFCECDPTSISWLYIPGREFAANRIIYTGGFAASNNRGNRMTCVVEFVHGEAAENIERDLRTLPGNLHPIATNHVRDAYVIQDVDTRSHVAVIKEWGRARGIHFCGRFAEWEYYNIDKAIEAAMKTVREIRTSATDS